LSWPGYSLIGLGLIVVALCSTLAIFYWRDAIFRRAVAPEPEPRPSKLLWPAVIIIGLMALIGFWIIGRYAANITPFGSSLLVLVSLVFAMGAIALSARYNEYLFKRSYSNYIKRRDWFWPWALWIASVVMVAFGLSSFGSNNLPALLVSDIVFTLTLVGTLAVILLLPFLVGAELFYNAPRALAFVGKLLIGLWHAILQLAVPFVLIRRGTILTWTVAVIPLVIPIWLAAYLAKKNYRIPLVLLWIIYGGLMLVLPWLTSPASLHPLFGPDWVGGWALLPSALAGGVGAVTCCLWLGWYFGVCLVFNGHNNELGGAARIERFKQFIRFRLTKDDLTGYVIAVDDVSMIGEPVKNDRKHTQDGEALKPKLIDVFHLVPKKT